MTALDLVQFIDGARDTMFVSVCAAFGFVFVHHARRLIGLTGVVLLCAAIVLASYASIAHARGSSGGSHIHTYHGK